MIRILLVEDHAIVRRGIQIILEREGDMHVVGEASDGAAALALVERVRPDVVIVDIQLDGSSGLDFLRALKHVRNRPQALVLSMFKEVPFVAEALREGASGYLVKGDDSEALVAAVRAIAAGQPSFSASVDLEAVQRYMAARSGEASDPSAVLTRREREVLGMVAQGFTNARIAHTLHISPRTAEQHRANAMHKLGLKNQAEVTQFAVRHGWPLATEIRTSTDRHL